MSGVIPSNEACSICQLDICDHTDEERADHAARIAAGHDALVNTADQAAVEKAAKTKRDLERRAKRDFEWLMNDPKGRRIMWSLIERAGIYRVGFVETRGDHASMAFLDGQKNIGIELMHRCIAETPAHYALMVKENGG